MIFFPIMNRNEEWKNMFRMDLITSLIYYGANDEKKQIDSLLQQAYEENSNNLFMYALYLLVEAQYRIQELALTRAENCLLKCETFLQELSAKNSLEAVEHANIAYIRLHYSILKSLCMVEMNDFKKAYDELNALDSALQAYSSLGVDTSVLQYSWLPLASTIMINFFLHSIYMSWIGCYDKSRNYTREGLLKVTKQLSALDKAAKGFAADIEFSMQTNFCLVMKMYFYLQSAINSLCHFEIQEAFKAVRDAIICSYTEHELFTSFRFSIHIIIGIAASIMNQISVAMKHFDLIINDGDDPILISYSRIFKMATKITQISDENREEKLKEIFSELDVLTESTKHFNVAGIDSAALLIRGILCSLNSQAIEDAEKYTNQAKNKLSIENKQFASRICLVLGKVYLAKSENINQIKALLGSGIANGIELKDLLLQLYGKKLYLNLQENAYNGADISDLVDHKEIADLQEKYESIIKDAQSSASTSFAFKVRATFCLPNESFLIYYF
jgi:hypothetical protein